MNTLDALMILKSEFNPFTFCKVRERVEAKIIL
jgi:hypothetical protein